MNHSLQQSGERRDAEAENTQIIVIWMKTFNLNRLRCLCYVWLSSLWNRYRYITYIRSYSTRFFLCMPYTVFLFISFPASLIFCNAYGRSHRESNKNENIGICKTTNYVKRYSSLNAFVSFSHEQCFSCRSTSQPISSEKCEMKKERKN